jgi:hypothetical protein
LKVLLIVLVVTRCFAAFAQLPSPPKAKVTVTEPQPTVVTKEDRKVIELISSLREVRDANKIMLKHNGRPLIIVVDNDPRKDNPYYTVSVSEDLREEGHSVTILRFDVRLKTYAIYFVDQVHGKNIPLAVWRKHGSKW